MQNLHVWLAGGVQMMLEKETVAWSKGLMAMPPGVHAMLGVMLSLLDRLAALELTVLHHPLQVCDMSSDALYQ